MQTPIFDFLRRFAARDPARFCMPGHKGRGALGIEALDLTEVAGADCLSRASGIIAESEENASSLFGCPTLYSTEGSSHALRAMCALALGDKLAPGRERPRIAVIGEPHRSLLDAAVLLDFALLRAPASHESLPRFLTALPSPPDALFLTTPDYRGRMPNLPAIARVCHARGIPLLADGAHAAALRFLPESLHPIDLGADFCCASAHKTLSALTPGAYLHLAPRHASLREAAREALALFGTTSPSYLVLASLDLANREMPALRETLPPLAARLSALREELTARGIASSGQDPLRLVIEARPLGYEGEALADFLRERGVEPDFADRGAVVLMATPHNRSEDFARLREALLSLPRRDPLPPPPPLPSPALAVLTPREAYFAPREVLPLARCAGRVLARASAACPPATPLLFPGERISPAALPRLAYERIEECSVVKE